MEAKRTILEVNAEVGELCRERRQAKGISLTQIASSMGISKMYLSDLETGRRTWSDDLLFKFNAALKL